MSRSAGAQAKLVLAFVQPFKLDAVTQNLEAIPDFPGMSVAEVRGFGRERTDHVVDADLDELEEFTDKVQIETVVREELVDRVVDAIAAAAHTGRYGDGMIFVLPVERSFRIAAMRPGGETE